MPDDLRWVKWWPQDWKGDAALRMCSLAARGLWKELLCIMHEANPYGFLLVSGKKPTEKQLASLVGATPREVRALMAELEAAGVYTVDDQGVVFSRRMVKDEARRVKGRIDGSRGGNPALVNPKTPDQDNPNSANGLTGGVNPQEAEIRGRERKNPNPSAQAEGDEGNFHGEEESDGRPANWHGRWKGLRTNGTNPRALGTNPRAVAASAEAARPAPPEPTTALWPLLKARGMTAAEFRGWTKRCAIDDAARRVEAPAFVAATLKREHGHAIEAHGWAICEAT
jgi:hypothetical protein